jgi:hypothetical protein
VQIGSAAQFVHSHAGVDEALERRAEVSFPRKVRRAPFRRQTALARVLDPCLHDRAVRVDLVEVAATQTLVAQRADAFEQQRVRVLQRAVCFLGCAVGSERPMAPPPHVSGREPRADRGTFPCSEQVDCTARSFERLLRVTSEQMCCAQIGQSRIWKLVSGIGSTRRSVLAKNGTAAAPSRSRLATMPENQSMPSAQNPPLFAPGSDRLASSSPRYMRAISALPAKQALPATIVNPFTTLA